MLDVSLFRCAYFRADITRQLTRYALLMLLRWLRQRTTSIRTIVLLLLRYYYAAAAIL